MVTIVLISLLSYDKIDTRFGILRHYKTEMCLLYTSLQVGDGMNGAHRAVLGCLQYNIFCRFPLKFGRPIYCKAL